MLRDPRSYPRQPAQTNNHQSDTVTDPSDTTTYLQNNTPLISPDTHALKNAEKTLDDINENFYGNTTPTIVAARSPSNVSAMNGAGYNENNNRMSVMNHLHEEMRRRASKDGRGRFLLFVNIYLFFNLLRLVSTMI